MALWFSNSAKSPPMIPQGNGKFLLWEEGAAIYSFRGGYSAPHLFSMLPDFKGVYHEIDTARIADSSALFHRLYYSEEMIGITTRSVCDLQITDTAAVEEPIFIRRLDGITKLEFRLSIPSYVRAVYHPSYRFGKLRADALFLTVPAGTAFDSGMTVLREQTAVLVFAGTLRYDSADGVIYYGGDLGELYVLLHSDPKNAVHAADRLLQAFKDFGEIPTAHPVYASAFSTEWKHEASSDPIQGLLMMQSDSGAVVSSHREPLASAGDLPSLTALFLQSGQIDAAGRMLLYWTEQSAEIGFIPSVLACEPDVISPRGQADAAASAAYLWATARYCRATSPTGKAAEELHRGMRSAFASVMQSFREGMLPFGMRTQAFNAGLLGRELLFQGSAEATAVAIAAAREFLDYCKLSGKRAAKEEKGYRQILATAEAMYENNFTYKGKIYRNAPRLETLTRRPRFIRGVCTLCQRDGAYPAEDTLELDKYGRYLCRRCFSTRRGTAEVTDPAMRFCSPRATALAALLTDSPAAIRELTDIALTYARRLRDAKAALPLRESDTDPLLLLALCNRRETLCRLLSEDSARQDALRKEMNLSSTASPEAVIDGLTAAVREVLTLSCEDGTLSALLCDTASLGARHAAGPTAIYGIFVRTFLKEGFDTSKNF